MRSTNLSILGLYHYDSHIFDDLHLPAGVDDETVIHSLLTDCAELEVLYPDPGFMKFAIGTWSAKQLPIWTKLYSTTQYDYNPIWNKDGTITYTETEGRSVTGSVDRSEDVTSGSDRTTATGRTAAGQSTTDQNVAAFNSAALEPQQKNDTHDSQSESENVKEDMTGSVNTTGSEDTQTHENVVRTHARTERGNIGITSTQELIERERAVVKFNIYDYIIDEFKKRFCLLIY